MLSKLIIETDSNRKTQNGQSRKIYKNSKYQSRSRSVTQKGTNNQGPAKQDPKMIRTKNTPPQLNQEITTATRKRSINLGKSIFLQNNKKTKQLLMWLLLNQSRTKKTEQWRQSQNVIVPDTQETDGDQKSNGEDANDFLFLEQGATHTNQTNRQ